MPRKSNDQDNAPAAAQDLGGDAGQAEVQARADEENAKGYRGTVADDTPNEAYTLQGQLAGATTPETDPDRE